MRWSRTASDIVYLRRTLPYRVRLNVPYVSRDACMTKMRDLCPADQYGAALITYRGVSHVRVDFLFATPELLQRFNDVIRPIIEQ